jgi:hypothetical protein
VTVPDATSRSATARTIRHSFPAITYTATASLRESLLENAGAFPRDPMDQRLVAPVEEERIDSAAPNTNPAGDHLLPAYTGGAPAAPTDSDHDGMPDAWETARGLDPQTPDHAGRDLRLAEAFKLADDATDQLLDLFLRDAQILVRQLNGSATKVDPILTNLNSASADAARATKDVTKLTAALNNPRTLADLKATLANARQLTARWEAVGGDVQKLSGDPRFLDGIRSVSVGLGKFFEELYPAATDSARQRQTRAEGTQGAGTRSEGSRANGNRAVDRLPPPPPPRRGRSLSAADRNEQLRGPQLPPSSRR